MTNEQAKSELMQIYMSLSEEKKKALDVAFKAMEALSYDDAKYHEEHGEVVVDKAVWEDAKRALEQCEDVINRDELLKAIDTWDRFGVDDTNSLFRLDNLSLPHYVAYIHYDDVVKCIKALPSVDIPPEHDGCKDCRYQDKGEDELPCCECKQNYMDKWKAISNKVGQWIDKGSLSCRCDQCGCKNNRETKFCPHCGARMVEPTCDTCEYTTAAFNPCNACKDKSEYKPQESEINNG